jgi:protein-S-isoprenylcysteine O-methyltransferase Ste14
MKSKKLVFSLFFWPFLFVVGPMFLGVINIWLDLFILSNQILQVIGFLLVFVGVYIVLFTSGLFIAIGKGSPAPMAPPTKLVIGSWYKKTRNPMYLGYFLILLAEFLVFGYILLIPFLFCVILFFIWYVPNIEEPKLEERFGQDYSDYKKNTPRWL